MKPLSHHLRERIVEAYEAGDGSYEELGDRFSVSKSVVGKLVRQHREHGTLDTFVGRCGRKPAIAGKTADRLEKHLREYPACYRTGTASRLGVEVHGQNGLANASQNRLAI